MLRRSAQWFHATVTRSGSANQWLFIAIGAGVGTLTGLGAIAFAHGLHVVEHFVHGLQEGHGLGPAWVWLILAPMIGMGLTGLVVHFFASDAKGHGVPQVMAALILKGGKMPLRTGVAKIVASILTVGSGGSAGTEGPIVQIGSVAGSVVGQKLGLDRQRMMTLVGCGAAAGISSIFNAPIAGVFFVLEILLRDFSVRTFTPIVVASVFSAVTTQAILGTNEAIFPVESLGDYRFSVAELPSYVVLGVICGLVAVGFNRFLHFGEDVYERLRIPSLVKPLTGGLLLGLLGIGYLSISNAAGGEGVMAQIPAFFGHGYIAIEQMLSPASYETGLGQSGMPMVAWLLAIFVIGKAVATTLTLASGGSGGVFAPSLVLGATVGGLVGMLLDAMGLIPEGSTPASYALVGMAAVLAGSMQGPMTAILILFELTRNIYVVLPIMLAAVVATVMAQLIDRDSIYTAKLRRAGVLLGTVRDLTLLRGIEASTVERVPMPSEAVYPSDPLGKLVSLHATHHVPDFVVIDEAGKYLGMVTGGDMRTALIDREAIPLLLVAELVREDLPTIEPEETLDVVIDKFSRNDVASLCIVDSTKTPIGLLTRGKVMQRYQRALESAD